MRWCRYHSYFFTKQSRDKNLNGLTVFDVHKLKMIFKGSEVNEIKGETVLVIGTI